MSMKKLNEHKKLCEHKKSHNIKKLNLNKVESMKIIGKYIDM